MFKLHFLGNFQIRNFCYFSKLQVTLKSFKGGYQWSTGRHRMPGLEPSEGRATHAPKESLQQKATSGGWIHPSFPFSRSIHQQGCWHVPLPALPQGLAQDALTCAGGDCKGLFSSSNTCSCFISRKQIGITSTLLQEKSNLTKGRSTSSKRIVIRQNNNNKT